MHKGQSWWQNCPVTSMLGPGDSQAPLRESFSRAEDGSSSLQELHRWGEELFETHAPDWACCPLFFSFISSASEQAR